MAAATALKKVMTGDVDPKNLSERDAKKVVGELVKKNSSLAKRADDMKENAAATATAMIGGVEMTSAAFAASMMEGYFGSEAIKVGNIDVRAIVGLGSAGYGAIDLLTNKGKGGGAHAVNIGAGILSSYLSSVGIQAGQALKQKGIGGLTATPQVKAPAVAGNIAYQEAEVVPGTTLMTEPAPPPEAQPSRVNRVVDYNQNRRNNRRRTIVQAQNSR